MPNPNKNSTQVPNQTNTPLDIDPSTAIPTICISVNEQNNNTIGKPTNGKAGVLNCLPDIFTDIDIGNRNEINANYLMNDPYKSYMFGKFLHLKIFYTKWK